MTIFAPAKVNLHLAVMDKRPDGFHNLESLFVALDFGDILHFEPITGGGNAIDLSMQWPATKKPDIPIEKNIVFKALSLFREKTGYNEGLKIRVEKHIPMGGGLGGGSSDAASTLLALNQMAGYPLEQLELLEIATALGSDVPFFVHQVPTAWVTGRGEHIEPLEPPSWHFVLINPGIISSTATAFRLLEQHRSLNFYHERHETTRKEENKEEMVRGCSYGSWLNHFLPVLPEKATYNTIISQLTQLGAEFANLSGAGSTCFGAFKEPELARKAALSLQNKWDFIQACSVTNSTIKCL